MARRQRGRAVRRASAVLDTVALVALKDVRVVHYERDGHDVNLMVEQVIGTVSCPTCGVRAQVKDRPVVHYVDLPVYGAPMHLAWKKHRMNAQVCSARKGPGC
jgi:transcription elongation factor Elf1